MSASDSISVRLEQHGLYWRAVWIMPGLGRQRRGLGARDTVTKRDALGLCRQIQAELATDPKRFAKGKSPTLDQWRERYFTVRTGLKADSAIDQRGTFALLIAHFGAEARLDAIDENAAANFRLAVEARKLAGQPIRTATVRKHIRNCKTIWAWALRGTRQDNPWRFEQSGVPSVAKDWATVTPADLERIVSACPADPIGRQCAALFALCRLAGLRAGEAMRLTWADVDYQAGLLRVMPEAVGGQGREEGTKQRQREVPMSPRVVELVKASAGSAGPCANLPVDSGPLHRLIKPIIREAGIPEYAKPLHTLRKNLETEWMRTFPVPVVCAWLGNSPAVAAKHYHRPEPEDIARVTGEVSVELQIAALEAKLAALKSPKIAPIGTVQGQG